MNPTAISRQQLPCLQCAYQSALRVSPSTIRTPFTCDHLSPSSPAPPSPSPFTISTVSLLFHHSSLASTRGRTPSCSPSPPSQPTALAMRQPGVSLIWYTVTGSATQHHCYCQLALWPVPLKIEGLLTLSSQLLPPPSLIHNV